MTFIFFTYIKIINLKSDCLLKILLIGNTGVGKSCLLLRYSVIYFIIKFHLK